MSSRTAAASAKTASAPITKEVRDHYDGLSWLYRVFWGDYLHHGLFSSTDDVHEAQLALLEYCSGLLPATTYTRILDAGCGYGTTTLYLAQRLRCRADGVSVSPRQIEYARRLAERSRLESRVTFSVEDIASFRYPGAPYDLIWAMESTEHFADKPAFFRDAAQALNRGGLMLVAAWAAGEDADRAKLAELARLSVCESFVSATDYARMMIDAGFTVVKAKDLTKDVARTWDIVESRVRWVRPFQRLLPRAAQEFSVAIPALQEAFHSGLLRYTVLLAERTT